MTAETHPGCSYECERPECIREQRDKLAARMAVTVTPEEIAAMVRKGVEAERERCARVCESLGGNGPGYIDDDWARMCADAIRDSRVQQPEAEAQGGGEVNMVVTVRDGTWVGTYAEWCRRKQIPPPSAPVGVDAPGSRSWMAEVCRAAALSLAAHGVRNDQLSKVADWIAQQPAAVDEADTLLRDLVEALDAAFISSWQSTAAWQKQLDAAREYLAAQHQEPKP